MTAGKRAASAGAACSMSRSGPAWPARMTASSSPWYFRASVRMLVQAAEQVLAVVGQVVPGVRAGDHHQVAGDLDRLGHLRRGIPGGGAGQVGGGDLDQVPVTQHAQVAVQAGDGGGGAGLAGAGAAGENQVLPGGPADRDAGRAAGLLGPQHRDQRGELPGGHLQARKRGQAARVR